ncbi:hypothetical protein G6F24_017748 [Rhizopus arrhizus]|nr:hypothetical protein G6F24_017748 [Rhizopus arrhizus]
MTGSAKPFSTSKSPKSCMSTKDGVAVTRPASVRAWRNSRRVAGPRQENIASPPTFRIRRHSASTACGARCQCMARLDHTSSSDSGARPVSARSAWMKAGAAGPRRASLPIQAPRPAGAWRFLARSSSGAQLSSPV